MKFYIEQITDENVLEHCALMMSQTEPWITLKRDLSQCHQSLHGNDKEIHVSLDSQKKLLGFIVLQMNGAFKGYIQSICVSPLVQGSGIGSALISHAEKRIFTVSPNVFMLVSSFNEKAARLYSRLGFEKIGTLRNFVVDGYDEFLLRKTIGSLHSFKKS